MPFLLHLTPEAEADLKAILDSYQSERRRREAAAATLAALQRLAANPKLATVGPLGRPAFQFSFKAGGVNHHWAATFLCPPGGKVLIVTQIYRPAM